METSSYPSQPRVLASRAKFWGIGGLLFVAIASFMAVTILPRTNTDDRGKAATSGTCSGSVTAPAASCNEKCITNDDCSSGMTCLATTGGTLAAGTTGNCRNPQFPSSLSCGSTTQPTSSPTSIPTPSTSTHTIKLVNHPVSSALTCMDFDALVEGGRVIEQTDSRIVFSSGWTDGALAGLSGGTNKYTCTQGNSVTFSSSASSLAYYATKAVNMGSVDVYVDGVYKTNFNTYAASTTYKQAMDMTPFLNVKPASTPTPAPPAGCVYQQVQCIQAPCPAILVCATPAASVAPATPVATAAPIKHTVTFTFHLYTSGQNMAIDYIKDGSTVIDDNSSLVSYSGTWIKGSDSSPYGGTYAATSVSGSAMSYVTTSTSITIRPYRYYTRGGLDIYVDGVLKQQVNDLNTGSGWSDITVSTGN